jgi:hypothetical protein
MEAKEPPSPDRSRKKVGLKRFRRACWGGLLCVANQAKIRQYHDGDFSFGSEVRNGVSVTSTLSMPASVMALMSKGVLGSDANHMGVAMS